MIPVWLLMRTTPSDPSSSASGRQLESNSKAYVPATAPVSGMSAVVIFALYRSSGTSQDGRGFLPGWF